MFSLYFQACVPGPNFTPGNTLIGGYGRYRRIQCQVNDQGPHVFQVQIKHQQHLSK